MNCKAQDTASPDSHQTPHGHQPTTPRSTHNKTKRKPKQQLATTLEHYNNVNKKGKKASVTWKHRLWKASCA